MKIKRRVKHLLVGNPAQNIREEILKQVNIENNRFDYITTRLRMRIWGEIWFAMFSEFNKHIENKWYKYQNDYT